MKRLFCAASVALLSACAPSSDPAATGSETPVAADESRPVAARVFTSGTIYTGLGDATVDTVALDGDGRILWTGSVDDLDSEIATEDAEFVFLNNAFMYPGFTDGHAHLLGIGQRELTLDLSNVSSVSELVSRVSAEADENVDASIIYGRGWIETGWPEGRMPMASDLADISSERPIILVRADGHALVANEAALAAAGITADTPDPDGGHIERDDEGNATGVLVDNAMNSVWALMASPSEDERRTAYVEAGDVYTSRGWTGVHNMSVNPQDAPLLQSMSNDGEMPLRLWNAFDVSGAGIASGREYETDTITNRAVKLYMDGALGSRGALLLEPYSDRPELTGLSLMSPEDLSSAMADADAGGYQLAIHAIGDKANRRILDAFEAGDYGPGLRWRIEHTQVLAVSDLARVGALGLIASMQPSHAIGDLKFAPDRLGMDRLAGAYAWKTLLDDGAVVVGGSDAPVEVGSPLIEFYAAVARRDLQGGSGEGWHPEEALSREQALTLFTSAPAFASFMEDDLGTIEPGKLGDFTVFDRDLMTVPEPEILEAKTVMTVIGGDVVWQQDN